MALNEEDIKLLLSVLRRIPLFYALNESDHREIISRIVLMYYPVNYKIFSEGEEGDALYIIKNGSVKIQHDKKDEDDEDTEVAVINDSGFFGEMALVSDAPRNASAKTLIDSEIFILNRDDFKTLLESNPILAEQISATVIHRTKENLKD